MPTNQKKIALIHDTIFPFSKGGAQRRFYEIGRRLSQKGYDVHLYGMKSWQGDDVIKFEGMTMHGICKDYPIYTKSGRRSIYQAIMFGLATFSLWHEEFDVMDCCGFPYFSLFPARLITWLQRKPMYSTWHEVWGYEYWKKYLGTLGIFGFVVEHLAAVLPDTIISVSDSTTIALKDKLGQKNNVVTIPNGIDFERICKIKPAKETSDVIFAGRLLPYKNVNVLIEATGIIAKENPRISLTVIGEGPERKKLEHLSQKLGIEKNVRFLGFIENEDDLFSNIMASKVLVLPSEREGFGIIVLEANACGLPVITIDHPQNAAKDLIIDEKNGVVVPLDKITLAGAITDQLKDNKDSFHYKSFVSSYDWDKIVKKHEEVYFSKEQ